ncbi:MAG TPA: hypothetical protein VGJ91_05045 [Polyangiaceae bacterium]|jgi:hypothetical protein
MAEELGPIRWRVWLLSDLKKETHVECTTRADAMRKGAARLGAAARFWDVDCEAVRA